MAITLITRIQEWLGTSVDDKPTIALPGSTFYEWDTGQQWIWVCTSPGHYKWVEDMRVGV
jgi:hypothetical protein